MLAMSEPDYDVYYVVEADHETGDFVEIDESLMLPLYWNIEDGWGFIIAASTYTEQDVLELDLPLDSHWVKVATATNFLVSMNTYQLNTTFVIERNFQVNPTTMITDPDSDQKNHLRII